MFVQSNPDYDLSKYQYLLGKRGVKWTHEGMKAADYASLDEEGLLALLVGAFRADHFAEGVLEEFVSEGYVGKWLGRLKCIDDERKPEEYKPALRQVKIGARLDVVTGLLGHYVSLQLQDDFVIPEAILIGGSIDFGSDGTYYV
jgi:hypothetical protein